MYKDEIKGLYIPQGGGLKTKSLEYAEAVGNYILNFSAFEFVVLKGLSSIIDPSGDEKGFAFMAYMQGQTARWELFVSLVKREIKSDEQKKVLSEFDGKFREYINFRNSIVHAIWPSLDNAGNVHTKIYKGELVKLGKMQIRVEDIISKNDEMCQKIGELEVFLETVGIETHLKSVIAS